MKGSLSSLQHLSHTRNIFFSFDVPKFDRDMGKIADLTSLRDFTRFSGGKIVISIDPIYKLQ